ncbi:MAG: DUF5591 domain-containing protein [Promethearchaeota archaeon]
MSIFFEKKKKKIGFSRIGRFPKSKALKKHIFTPHILIPINKMLMKQFNFIKEFYDHDTFILSSEKYLKKDFLLEKFRNTGLIYTHTGTLTKFREVLNKYFKILKEYNILTLIPFNIPTIAINKEFAEKEINNYLENVEILLNSFPNINMGLTIKIFDYPELINNYIRLIKKSEKIKFLNFSDLFNNFSNFRGIIKVIIKIKQEIDSNTVLIASGHIIPKYYPILIYLGIDIIDTSYLLYLSSKNFYDTIEYLLPIYKIKELPCSCIVCREKLKTLMSEKYSSRKFELLCLHNLITAKIYMNKIIQYLNYEDFRAFVEKSAFDDTYIISLLKILDKEYFKIIRFETPITQKAKKIRCFGPISYYRPDFREFRERIIQNFEPEPWTQLIIIFPCSAKKPYSESKSHKKFLSVLRKFPEFPSFQEFVLTSPLGVIPRQLENIYPANSYDISVTGEWDEEELKIGVNMLCNILKKYNPAIPIICHLEGGYLKLVKTALRKINRNAEFSEIHNYITSKDSLNSLEKLIQINKDNYKLNKITEFNNFITKSWIRKLVKIIDYQFGQGSGEIFVSKGIKTRRNKTNTKIELLDINNQIKLGFFKFETGQIALTINGANRLKEFLLSKNSNILIFNGDKIKGNTLFRAGLVQNSSNLSPSDSIIILNRNKEKIIGVGNLIIGSNYITNSKTGRIADIDDTE